MSFFGPSPVLAVNELQSAAPGANHGEDLVGFTPVPVAGGGGTVPRVAAEYQVDVILPWGESPLLQNPAGNPPRGTVNNCSQGSTPWGTYLQGR